MGGLKQLHSLFFYQTPYGVTTHWNRLSNDGHPTGFGKMIKELSWKMCCSLFRNWSSEKYVNIYNRSHNDIFI